TAWRENSTDGWAGRAGLAVPEPLVIGGEAVAPEKAAGILVEAPDIECQERDAELLDGGPPGADQRLADALPAKLRPHADVLEIDHLIGLPPGLLGTADHLG